MVQEIKSNYSKKSKGKFCHIEKEHFLSNENLQPFYYKPLEAVDLKDLYNKVRMLLEDEGFVFYTDSGDYNYRAHKGNLVEFAIQFHHIK